jgi:hypothetical protein
MLSKYFKINIMLLIHYSYYFKIKTGHLCNRNRKTKNDEQVNISYNNVNDVSGIFLAGHSKYEIWERTL